MDYVRDLDSYKTCNLTEPVLIEIRDLNCSSGWQFVYKFDLISEKSPACSRYSYSDCYVK